MNLTFYSIDSNEDKVIYTVPYKELSSTSLEFEDKTIENTIIRLDINNTSSILFKRIGNVDMEMNLILNKKTIGYYKNHLGLEFEFSVLTNKIEFIDNKLIIEYNMTINDDESSHKLSILFNKNT